MINRREALLRLTGLLGLGAMAGSTRLFASDMPNPLEAGRALNLSADKPFTIAHITDIHITNRLDAQKWVAKALHQLQSESAKPSFIVNTGDSVMDSSNTDREAADRQWKIWHDTIKNECSLPVYSCLGNHDIWGSHHKKNSVTRKDPMYGKKLGMDGVGIEKAYYSFDQGGWHIVMLDSIMSTPEVAWQGLLDDEQFHWLEADLKAVPANRPIMVCSHMPIIQVCSLSTMKPDDKHSYTFGNKGMMGDARRIIDLFHKHPNVKLCFSGHIHKLDRVELNGVTYICDGAMCGNKWKENKSCATPGYSITTLHPDGKFDYDYKTFGWTQPKA